MRDELGSEGRARPSRLTRRRPSECWRLETAGACTKSSAAPGRPIGPLRSGTTGSASRLSSKGASPIARTPATGCFIPAHCCSETMAQCFECGHAHGIGDRCISLNVHEEQFSEIAAAAGSTSRFRFSAPSLPPSPKALPIIAHMEALSCAPVFAALGGTGVAAHRARHRSDDRRSTRLRPRPPGARRDGWSRRSDWSSPMRRGR